MELRNFRNVFLLGLALFLAGAAQASAQCVSNAQTDNARNRGFIADYYAAYSKGEYWAMQDVYSLDIVFQDPVFGVLKGKRVYAMVHMLAAQATDLRFDLSNLVATDTCGSVDWVAYYTYNGHRVANHGHSEFVFVDGLITQHHDTFKYGAWRKQAMPYVPIPQCLLRKIVLHKLGKFIGQNPEYQEDPARG